MAGDAPLARARSIAVRIHVEFFQHPQVLQAVQALQGIPGQVQVLETAKVLQGTAEVGDLLLEGAR